jgi:homoserine dehydrogenase
MRWFVQAPASGSNVCGVQTFLPFNHQGIHVVTANKKGLCGGLSQYNAILRQRKVKQNNYMYEVSPWPLPRFPDIHLPCQHDML